MLDITLLVLPNRLLGIFLYNNTTKLEKDSVAKEKRSIIWCEPQIVDTNKKEGY
jgi:hypothetical protein